MTGEAVTQYLVGILDDDEGIGIDADHQILQVRQLALLHGTEDDLGIIAGVVALGVEVGDTPAQVVIDGVGNALVLTEVTVFVKRLRRKTYLSNMAKVGFLSVPWALSWPPTHPGVCWGHRVLGSDLLCLA